MTRAMPKFFGTPPPGSGARTAGVGGLGRAGRGRGPRRRAPCRRRAAGAGRGPGGRDHGPALDPLFALAAAVVTDTGGILATPPSSPLASTACRRVVGAAGATAALRDGDVVEVDGDPEPFASSGADDAAARERAVLVAVGLACVLVPLNTTMLAVGLPAVVDDLGVEPGARELAGDVLPAGDGVAAAGGGRPGRPLRAPPTAPRGAGLVRRRLARGGPGLQPPCSIGLRIQPPWQAALVIPD